MPVYAVTYLTCVLESERHELDFQSAGAGILQSMRAELPKPQNIATVLVPAIPHITDTLEDPRAISMANMLNLPRGRRMVPCRSLHELTYDRMALNRLVGTLSESAADQSVIIFMAPSVASDFFRKQIGPAQVCMVRAERRLVGIGSARRGYQAAPDTETMRMTEEEVLGDAEKTVLLSEHDVQVARNQVSNLQAGIALAQRSIDENTPVEIPLAAMRELMNASRYVAVPAQTAAEEPDEPMPFGIPLGGRILLWCVLIVFVALVVGSASRELVQ